METMFAEMVASLAGVSSVNPNSSLNDVREILVPTNADCKKGIGI